MNKFSTYILLILVFLGLSKSFSPSEQRISFIENEYAYSNFFKGAPLSVILIDYYKAGFIIKTYFHRYKIIHAFKTPEYRTVRVSKKFWIKNKENLGLSVFARREIDNFERTTPLPPGALFIGDPSYGSWESQEGSSKKVWIFHRAYRNFPEYLGWGEFLPDQEFHKAIRAHAIIEKTFYGTNHEFGTSGSISSKIYQNIRAFRPEESLQVKVPLKRFLNGPWANEGKNE